MRRNALSVFQHDRQRSKIFINVQGQYFVLWASSCLAVVVRCCLQLLNDHMCCWLCWYKKKMTNSTCVNGAQTERHRTVLRALSSTYVASHANYLLQSPGFHLPLRGTVLQSTVRLLSSRQHVVLVSQTLCTLSWWSDPRLPSNQSMGLPEWTEAQLAITTATTSWRHW